MTRGGVTHRAKREASSETRSGVMHPVRRTPGRDIVEPMRSRSRGGPLFTFRLIPVIAAILARRGVDVAGLLEEAGLPLAAMRGEVTAPLSRMQDFIAR